jgi:UDP-2,3-diacylglucosamine pyrophosphatase LpxH
MSQDKALTFQRLSELWQYPEAPVLDIHANKYVIMSDIHLGDGKGADDLVKNEKTLEGALNYYNQTGYSLILLGDIEEFWQFDLDKIISKYQNTVYNSIKAFGDDRVYRVFGNHDIDWKTLPDPAKNTPTKPACATEALKMKDSSGNARILLVHGHQGDKESDKNAWSSRFWVRLYKFIEPAIKIDRLLPAKKCQIMKNYEKILYSWAKEKKVILICGHTHRAIFASKSWSERLKERMELMEKEIKEKQDDRNKVKKLKEDLKKAKIEYDDEKAKDRVIDPTDPGREPLPCYFNDGCALYPDGITVIEIANDKIGLVKWEKGVRKPPYQEDILSSFIAKVTG